MSVTDYDDKRALLRTLAANIRNEVSFAPPDYPADRKAQVLRVADLLADMEHDLTRANQIRERRAA